MTEANSEEEPAVGTAELLEVKKELRVTKRVAEEAMRLMSDDQLAQLRDRMDALDGS